MSPDYSFVVTDHRILVKELYAQAKDLIRKGFRHVEITGHDPIEYEYLPEYISWLKSIGFKEVTLATHGRNLSDKDLCERFIRSGLDAIRIPVYGSNAKIHDSVTRSPGSFDETISGLRNISCLGIDVFIVSMILKENIDDMENIVDIARSFNAELDIIQTGVSCKEIVSHMVDYEILRERLPDIYSHCESSLGDNFNFFDFAHCLFGSMKDHAIFTEVPDMSDTYSVPEIFATGKSNVPNYRIMTKLPFCKECTYNRSCGGFRKNQVLEIGIPDRSIVPRDFLL